jgi:hypothetical protein
VPTAEVTAAPTAEPTDVPSVESGDVVLEDDFTDPASGWPTGESGPVSVQYADGSLQLAVSETGQAVWSQRQLEGEYAVVSFAAEFTPSTDGGGAGTMCRGDDSNLYGAIFTSDGRIIFVTISGNVTDVLISHEGLDFEFPPGAPTLVGVECLATATGALRIVAVTTGGPAAVYESDTGPASFGGVAIYAESIDSPAEFAVSRTAAFAQPDSLEGMTADGEDLLTHVPGDLQQGCIEVPSSTADTTAVLHCFLQPDGEGPDLLQFKSFPGDQQMLDDYADTVEQFGTDSVGTCQEGPHETTWSLGETTRGRLQCAPQVVGIRFDWTDEVLTILSTLIDFDGSYEGTYDVWLDAGPVDSPI